MKPEKIIAENELPTAVVKAITQGRKVEAIKLLREKTGLGLANAKVLVDRATNRYARLNPTVLGMTQESHTGRLVGVLLVLVLALVCYRYLNLG